MPGKGSTPHRFTRKEFSALLWSEPVAKLAGRPGV